MKVDGDAAAEKQGCWVDVFQGENFDKSEHYTRVYGPTQLRELEDLHGEDWDDEMNSIIVGPGAQVTLFQDEDFTDNHLVVGPGQRIPRLRDYQLADEIDSMRIVCARPPEAPVAVVVKEKEPKMVVITDAGATMDGVWVDLFEGSNFSESGAKARLKGPAQFSDVRNVFGRNWRDKPNSIVVGPDAQVIVYSGESFEGERLVLSPGQRVTDLESFDFGNDVESIKVMKASSTR